MFERILVGTDGSDGAALAVAHAVDLAAALGGSEVTVATVFEPAAPTMARSPAGSRLTREVARALLGDAVAAHRGRATIATREVRGEGVQALADLAGRERFDLLVVGNRTGGSHGPGGSVARLLARRASIAVLVVDTVGGATPGYRRLAAVACPGASDVGSPVHAFAVRLASALGGTVVAVEAGELDGPARLPLAPGRTPTVGAAADLPESGRYDLLVLGPCAGTARRGLAARADRLSRDIGVSVLLVPGVADAGRSRGRTGKEPSMARGGPEALADVPLFAGLSRRHLRHIAGLSEEEHFTEGTPLAQEGKPGESFYVILEGEAKVVRGGRRVAQLIPGDFFGEIALIDGGPRTASVVATTPLTTLTITRKRFRRMLDEDSNIVLGMLEELARRLRNSERSALG